MNLPIEDLPGALIVIACFATLIGFAELLTRRFHPSPEGTRKLVHLGGGLVCLLFPFFFRSHLTVLALAGGMALLFAFGRRYRFLQSLNRVERKTHGSEFYPFAVWAAFWLSQGVPWLFISSLLVLAVADAAAALIGSRYGRIRYTVEHEEKSLEGSAVFFLLAFLVVELPLFLLSPLPPVKVIGMSFLAAAVVTGIEAISRGGRDNLFVPIAVCVILEKLSLKPVSEIVYQTLSFTGLCLVLAIAIQRSKRFNTGGAICVMLFVYACWSLGSEVWSFPPLSCFAVFFFIRSSHGLGDKPLLRVSQAVRLFGFPLLILFVANLTGRYSFWFSPFVAAICGGFLVSLLEAGTDRRDGRRIGLRLVAAVWFAGCIVPWLLQAEPSFFPAGVILLLLSLLLFVPRYALVYLRAAQVSEIVCAAALIAAQYAGLPQWRPVTESLMMIPNL